MQSDRHGGAVSPGLGAIVKRHPQYSEHEYFLAVEAAFEKWEATQAGR
jgi:hypothetical protein